MNELRNQVQPKGRHEEDSVNLMIGKVASLYDITVQTLRHYDKIDLFRPEVVSEETGYRYYSVFQLRQLEYILFLRGLGLSLSEIKTILDRLRHDESWSDVLQVHLAAVQDQLRVNLGLETEIAPCTIQVMISNAMSGNYDLWWGGNEVSVPDACESYLQEADKLMYAEKKSHKEAAGK